MNFSTLILVFIGGGCGSVLRYLISTITAGINTGTCHFAFLKNIPFVGNSSIFNHIAGQLSSTTPFPIGTLICNVCGCFLIGLFNALSARFGWTADTRLMLTVGLCGGFTTFSTFSNEGLAMLNANHYGLYATYTALSIILGLLAVLLGMKV